MHAASPIRYDEPDIAAYRAHIEQSMMEHLGLKVKWGKYAFDEFGYLAGSDARNHPPPQMSFLP